ncbi:hypothetical protein BN946_scf185044.g7 [Trametes cinnabarina]|uniref:BTB domain-containing protein n=1 Tax=Pycnoporus cinnabarinus TaxID=5643 RepID=A0A060S735_PYCCI|nr:hypothetical protein BN946_scf185044.g7 [Trametes cinnabarina]
MSPNLRDQEFFFELVDFQVRIRTGSIRWSLPLPSVEQIDGTVFRVYSTPFQDSVFFRELFYASKAKKHGRGEDQERTKQLRFKSEDVSAADFRNLLRVLFKAPSLFATRLGGRSPLPATPLEDGPMWLTVMRLVNMWKFETVREDVIGMIDRDGDDVLRLAVAVRYDIPGMYEALEGIVVRETPLEVDEYQLLGLELAVKVVKYRELCRARNGSAFDFDASDPSIAEIFGEPFAELVAARNRASSAST